MPLKVLQSEVSGGILSPGMIFVVIWGIFVCYCQGWFWGKFCLLCFIVD